MKQILTVLLTFFTLFSNAQTKPNIIKNLNFRSNVYVTLNQSQEIIFEKYLSQLNKDRVYRIVSHEMCEKYKKGTLNFEEEENTGYPLQITYKKVINFENNYLIKFELDNCVGGQAYYRDFMFFYFKQWRNDA